MISNASRSSHYCAHPGEQSITLHRISQPLSDATVLPWSEPLMCRIALDNVGDMRYQTDGLPRVAILCPQGGITFDASQQMLGVGGPDFGGQLVYIKALAVSLYLAGFPAVDILTRRFAGAMADQQAWPEVFGQKFELHPDHPEVRVVRLPAGGEHFVPKEQLWNVLPEWASEIAHFYDQECFVAAAEKDRADTPGSSVDYRLLKPAVTAHYADAGLVGHLLQMKENYPLCTMTAHSLGAQKKRHFLDQAVDITPYNFHIRLPAERKAARSASTIICNSHTEKNDQWTDEMYHQAAGAFGEKCEVIPPGIDPVFWGQADNKSPAQSVSIQRERHEAQRAFDAARQQLHRDRQHLPTILLCGRLDRKKGYAQALHAYAQSPELQEKANIALVFANAPAVFADPNRLAQGDTRAYIHEMNQILPSILDKLIMPDIPQIRQAHLAQIYQTLANNQQGIYCHAALQEPFGLALTEAMASGMLVVATDQGGPVSILDNGRVGRLMNVKNPASIRDALLDLLNMSKEARAALQRAAFDKAKEYSWASTGESYARHIIQTLAQNNVPCSSTP